MKLYFVETHRFSKSYIQIFYINFFILICIFKGVDIQKLAENYQKECSYEPELHPGATFKLLKIKATLKLFTTGSITLTAPSVLVAKDAINQIYPILLEFKRTFPSEQYQLNNTANQVVIKKESEVITSIQQQKIFESNSYNSSSMKIESDYKPPVQSSFSNFSFYNNVSIYIYI